VVDRSADFAQLAVQGPRATEILAALTVLPLGSARPFTFLQGAVAGADALVARTGYTGEDGWEVYCAPGEAPRLWNALLDTGRPHGSYRRASARVPATRAALPLYGLSCRAPRRSKPGCRFVRLDKGEFVGRAALRSRTTGLAAPAVGIERQAGIPRQGYPIECDRRGW
jgi:aminomethyltransferase